LWSGDICCLSAIPPSLWHVEKARAAGDTERVSSPRMRTYGGGWRGDSRFACVPEPLVGFRQHAASLSAEDTGKQELAGLYVQYLLLSELWGLPPRPQAEVGPLLLGLS